MEKSCGDDQILGIFDVSDRLSYAAHVGSRNFFLSVKERKVESLAFIET